MRRIATLLLLALFPLLLALLILLWAPAVAARAQAARETALVATPSGLRYEVLRPGAGQPARRGEPVTIHFTAWLPDGERLSASRQLGEPTRFRPGSGEMIAGVEEGVVGMRVGGVRRLHIPPRLAYGSRGAGRVPPRSWLVCEVELLGRG